MKNIKKLCIVCVSLFAIIAGVFAQENIDIDSIKKRAESGDAVSQTTLGMGYENGWGGLKKDPENAFRWYKKAADQNFAYAQYCAGWCYLAGFGVRKAESEGVRLIKKSIKKEDEYSKFYFADAYSLLADCYYRGYGVTPDKQQVLYCRKKAKEYGYKENDDNKSFKAGELMRQICINTGDWIATFFAIDITWKGSGTKQDPYIISSAQELADLAFLVNHDYDGKYYKAHYALGADIDLDKNNDNLLKGINWIPIGSYTGNYRSFSGTFDGRFHKISGICIKNWADEKEAPQRIEYAGLFGKTFGGVIKNVILGNGRIDNDYVVSQNGALVGSASGTKIICCANEGTTVLGARKVGGLVGGYGFPENASWESPCISFCYNKASVVKKDSFENVGGIVGNVMSLDYIKDERKRNYIIGCYNAGKLKANGGNAKPNEIGGVLGSDDVSFIKNCYFLEGCGTERLIGEKVPYRDKSSNPTGKNLSTEISCSSFKAEEAVKILNELNSVSKGMFVMGKDGLPEFKK